MFATLGGCLALLLGLVVLLVPLLTPELSRARDAVWGAVVLLLGLVLVTSSDRLGGSPMVAVLCGGLLIGRLGTEVGQQRWRALTPEEQQRLGSGAHWRTALGQVLASLGALQGMASQTVSDLLPRQTQAAGQAPTAFTPTAFKGKGKGKTGGQTKRWVRPETNAETGHQRINESGPATPAKAAFAGDLEPAPAFEEPTPEPRQTLVVSPSATSAAPPAAAAPQAPEPPAIEVSSFAEIEALVDAAWGGAPQPAQAAEAPAPSVAPDASLAGEAKPTSPIPTQAPAEAGATESGNEAG
jgi:isoleucyl-tRNA synthetase